MVKKSRTPPVPPPARKRAAKKAASAQPRAAPRSPVKVTTTVAVPAEPEPDHLPGAAPATGKDEFEPPGPPSKTPSTAPPHIPQGDPAMTRILLIDLAQREVQARTQLQTRLDYLNSLKTPVVTQDGKTVLSDAAMSAAQREELADLKRRLGSEVAVDEFYQTVAAQVARSSWVHIHDNAKSHLRLKHGLFGTQQVAKLDKEKNELDAHEREVAAVCGLLQLDNLTDTTNRRFIRAVAEAQGEYQQSIKLFDAAFDFLLRQPPVSVQSQIGEKKLDKGVIGCVSPPQHRLRQAESSDPAMAKAPPEPEQAPVPSPQDKVEALDARTLAQVVRRLVEDKVTADDTWLSSRLDSAFSQLTGAVAGAPASTLEINLPDLEEAVDIDIVKENLHAVQAIYFSFQLEEMRMYQVVERIVELFRQGMLPLGRGKVGDYLYKYYQKAAERITEGERRDLYFRCFGAPGGNPNIGEPNRDFNELWLRFVSAVSSFARQQTVERVLRDHVPMAVSSEQVRKAGRDLGSNLSRNGYGIAYNAAIEMQQSIVDFIDVLTNPDLRNAFGARDMWQVIDLVNANYLGGPRNTHRFRTQSRAGAVIIRWIANNVQRLSNVTGPVLVIDQIVNPQLIPVSPTHKATVDPTDWDLVNACEQWLAVGGVQDQSVEQYAQPIESPITSARPIGMPQMARDALDAAGISLPA
jgi:hypothetical protein